MRGPARARVVALRARGALGAPRAVLLGPGDTAAVVSSADHHPPLAVGVHGLLSGDVPAARPARYGYRTAGICVGSVCVTAIRPAAHRSSSATQLDPQDSQLVGPPRPTGCMALPPHSAPPAP